MKYISILILSILISSISFAQQGINYKALIKDANNAVVANQSITVQFSILQGVAQTNVYQETHTPTTDANGIIIINIGEGTVVSGVFDDIAWASDDHFLNTQINTGSGLVDMGTTGFKTVPYALSAKTAANVTGLEAIDEGNGNGLVRVGRDAANYGDIGENAVDLSHSSSPSTTSGATGNYSTAMGSATTASGAFASALGNQTTASGNNSFSSGNSTAATGTNSFAMGAFTTAEAASSLAIGRYNVGGGSSNAWVGNEPLFEIGNGTSDTDRNNALTVLKDGRIGIGTTTPSLRLDVGGNSIIRGNLFLVNSGRLAIGTGFASATLDVVGNAEINGNASISGNVFSGGDLTSNGEISGPLNITAGKFLYGERVAFTAFENTPESISNGTNSSNYFISANSFSDRYNTLVSGTFTAPRDGLYFFSTTVSFSNGDGSDDTMWLGFSENGNTIMNPEISINPRALTSNGVEHSYSYSTVIQLFASDTVQVLIRSVSATSPVLIEERIFTGYYLGD